MQYQNQTYIHILISLMATDLLKNSTNLLYQSLYNRLSELIKKYD